ncbi:fatty acid desaturase [Pseudomonas aeruginosa]|nr:fatty acid desaturase [Pseudomonas aeruginosa]
MDPVGGHRDGRHRHHRLPRTDPQGPATGTERRRPAAGSGVLCRLQGRTRARPPCTRLDPGRCLVLALRPEPLLVPPARLQAQLPQRLAPGGRAPEAQGLPALHWRNELIWWYAISALFLLGFSLAFGWLGAIFFLGQSVMAFTLLEIVNYVEHYGLHRRRLDNGRYERTTPEHSWNSNFLLTNLFLFHLQRHSDHHAYAKRRYQVLRHYDSSPQLPNGYAGMIVLALFPPLWRAVMDPKVRAYYAGEEYQLTDTQRI